MPWFDETYFASMARNFLQTGDFFAPVCPLMDYYYPQSKAYGPGYFVLLAGVFKIFGFGILQVRTPGLLLGFGFILIGYRLLKDSGCNAWLRNIFFLTLLFDPIFLQNIHSGRMDSLALFLSGLGSLFVLRGTRNSGISRFITAGLFLGLAILCTPRVAVNIAGACFVAGLFFLSQADWKNWWKIFLLPVVIGLLYSIWIFWGFGGYLEAWNYFFGQPREKLYYDNLAQGYISFRKYIPPFQFPALSLLLVLIISWLIYRRKMSWLFWICFFNLFAYFVLVRDTGIYSIFSIPWVYLILAELGNHYLSARASRFWIQTSYYLILLLNLGVFGIKQTVVFLSAPSRDNEKVFQEFSTLIPKGSRVIGDDAFFYTAIRNNCDFQYIDRGAAGFQRLDYHLNEYDYEYIVVRNPVSNPAEFGNYQKAVPLKKVGEIHGPGPSPAIIFFETQLKKFGFTIPSGYRGVVYKR